MKQFLLYVLATIAGLWITIILSIIGSVFMFIVMIASSASSSQPSISDHSILHLELNGPIVERAGVRSLREEMISELQGGGHRAIALNEVIKAIDHAAEDSKIEGIYIDADGVSGGVASVMSIAGALERFKESGKWVVAYSDAYAQSDYVISSTADSLWLNPVGMVDIHGFGASIPYFKELLDKVGIEAQVIKVGTYKSAVEPYILTEPSAANREQIKAYITPIWQDVAGNVASWRDVTPEDVNLWADSLVMTQNPATFAQRRIVSSLAYRHEALQWMADMTDRKDIDKLRFVTPSRYVKSIKKSSSKNRIAVLYAEGDIVDDGSEGIVGRKMAPLILDLANNDDIDALVLRVNSGGGSAFASEQIWEALEQFKAAGKKFYVSMGDVAASGGYYISCGADRIYCQPVTITGSIGIFGIIPSFKGLTDKIGVNFASVSTNPNANIELTSPMTPVQRQAMQNMINRGYETFVGRCAEGRNMPVDSIKAIAEGRVWDGVTALRIGLVDQLGTLQDCVNDLAAECGYDKYEIVEYPKGSGSLLEEIMAMSSQVKESIVTSELGEARPYYEALKRFKDLEPVQCRMQPVTIE